MLKKLSMLCLALGLLLSAPCSQAQEPFNVENVLPAKTLVFTGVTNGKQYCDGLKATNVWELLNSKEWQDFFKSISPEFLQMVKQQKQMIEQRIGFTLEEIKDVFAGQLSLAVVDVKFQGPMPMPVVLLAWDLGKQKEKFAAFFAKIRQQLYMMQPGLAEKEYEVAGYKVLEITTPMMPIYMTYFGNVLLVCPDKAFIENTISAKAMPQAPLAKDPQYVAVKNELLAGKAGKLFYLNLRRAREMALQMMGPKAGQVKQMLQMSGLDGLDALGFGVSQRGKQIVESFYAYTPNGRTGVIASIFPNIAANQKLLPLMPEKVIAFAHGYFGVANLYDTAINLFKTFSPREYEQAMAMKQQMEKQLGIKIDELIASLGEEYLFSVSCSGSLIPDIGIQITLKDMESFQKIVQALLRMVPKKFLYHVNWQGHNLTYFNVSSIREPIPVAPTIVIEDNRVLFTLFPEAAKNLLLAKNGKMPADCIKCLNKRPYTMAEYLNIKAFLIPLYKTAVPLIQAMVPRHKLPIEPALLPSGKLLEKHLQNMTTLTMFNKQGMLWEIHSDLGTIPFVIAAGGAAYAAEQFNMFGRGFRRGRRHRRSHRWEKSRPRRHARVEVKPMKKPVKAAAGSSLKGNFLALEEIRTAKSTAANMQSVLRRSYVNKGSLNVSLHVQLPNSTVAHGDYDLFAKDNLGNKLMMKKMGYSKYNTFSSFTLRDIKKGKGHVFKFQFGLPARKASTFSVKGKFAIKVGGKTVTAKVPSFGLLKKDKYALKDLKDLQVTFLKSQGKRISMQIVGAKMRIVGIEVWDGKKLIKNSGSWSSGYKDKYKFTYNYRNAIPDTAVVVLQYIESIDTKYVDIDVAKQALR